MLRQSAHTDTFSRDNLPPADQWPDLLLDGFDYPDSLNAAFELTDAMVEKGFGDHTALIGNGRRRTYKELTDWTNRLANALVDDLKLRPGNRVLIRSANNPAMVACWLAATKAGAVVVNTMPMLRAAELKKYVDKAEITHALCDTRPPAGGFTLGLIVVSTPWLSASIPVAAVRCGGSDRVSSGSQITTSATMLRLTATHFDPSSSDMTQARPTSAPVPAAVGIAIWGATLPILAEPPVLTL